MYTNPVAAFCHQHNVDPANGLLLCQCHGQLGYSWCAEGCMEAAGPFLNSFKAVIASCTQSRRQQYVAEDEDKLVTNRVLSEFVVLPCCKSSVEQSCMRSHAWLVVGVWHCLRFLPACTCTQSSRSAAALCTFSKISPPRYPKIHFGAVQFAVPDSLDDKTASQFLVRHQPKKSRGKCTDAVHCEPLHRHSYYALAICSV